MSERAQRCSLGVAVSIAVLYVPLLGFAEDGTLTAFRYLAADAFYYLAIADHSQGAAFYTYDGTHATNGFHPLWGAGLHAAFALFDLAPRAQLVFALFASAALVALGSALFALALQRLTGSFSLSLLAAVPGFYALLLPSFNPHYSPIWSFVNGMESPLSLFCFGALLYLAAETRGLERPERGATIVALSACVTAAVLARLDDVVLWPPLALVLLHGAGSTRERLRRLALFAAIPTLAIGAYLVANWLAVGVALPVSGTAKSQGLVSGLLRNGYATLTTLMPFVDVLGRNNVTWHDEAYRVAQMLVPASAALAWLMLVRRSDRREPLTTALACYVLLKAGYNFALVGLWQQGHWYYPLAIASFSWIVAVAAARGLGRWRPRPSLRVRRVVPALALLYVLLAANAYAGLKRHSSVHAEYHDFWQRRGALEARLEEACPGCGVVEFDDGVIAYALERPVMSGSGLTLDAQAFAARRAGRLLDVAWERGFRAIGALYYAPDPGVYGDEAALRQDLGNSAFLQHEDVDRWHFELLFRDEATGLVFIAFRPR